MPCLLLERDGTELAAIPLAGPGLEIGSAPGNDLRLCGHGIRPFHLVLRLRRRRWWAVARGGAPLCVEGAGERHAVPLDPDHRVVVGPYRISVSAPEDPPEERGRLPVERTRPVLERPAATGSIVLQWTGPDGRLLHRRLESGTILLGRATDCDVTLADPAVSARHARITVDGDRALLEDLASLNGCHLDERRVFVAELRPGSTLRLGGTEIEVRREEEVGRAAVRPGRMVPTPGLAPVLERLRLAALSREPCVLTGETGCGKEVLARRLHEMGPRRNGPFVAVNAAALPPELAESILFGHQRGSFTGATETHRGAFERAHGGTLLLDELGEMRIDLQAKLLRALEEGAVLPIGAERPIPVDVRVVAATNREPLEAVASGRLRLDLWHRLAVFVVRIPPLRERPQDIAPLAQAFLDAMGLPAHGFTPAAIRALARHRWPGNVRELRNVVVRAALASTGPWIDEPAVRNALDEPLRPADVPPAEATRLLAAHHGNISAAARAAGLPRTTFRELLERERRRTIPQRTEPRETDPVPPDGPNRRLHTRLAG